MNVQFDFSGRHVMVFGGTTGINLGIAQHYAMAGARVSVASRKQANVDAALATLGHKPLAWWPMCAMSKRWAQRWRRP